jgi:hypothetical protein
VTGVVLDPRNPDHLAAARAVLAAAAEAPPVFEPTMIDLVPRASGIRGYLVTEENFDQMLALLEGELHAAGVEFFVKNPDGRKSAVGPGDVVVRVPEGCLVLFADEIGSDRLWQVRA